MNRTLNWYCNASIKKKITISISMVFVVMLISFAAFVYNDVQMMKKHLISRSSTLADTLGANSVTSLIFFHPEVAGEVLASTKFEPSIRFACTYDKTGRIYARHGDKNESPPPITFPIASEGIILNGKESIDIIKPIWHDEQQVGALLLRVDTAEVNQQLWQYASVFVTILAFTFAVTLVTTSMLHNSISRPIIQMAEVMRRVTHSKDYTCRVEKKADDELGVLCDGFNKMLGQIEHRSAENRELNRQLTQSAHNAEAANRSKSEFLANMSHEIRTPMTAILGFSDIVLGNVKNSTNIDALKTIKRNGEYLLELINDILDISKIESGKIEVENVECSPHQIVAEVVSLMRVRAASKSLPLEVEFVGPIPQLIHTDPTRLRQILINLIGNAIKFTEAGKIRLVVQIPNVEIAQTCIRFDIIDTGIGLTQEQLGRIFLPFSQADSSTTRKFGGTGLGLTISKRMVEMLGGEFDVRSKSNQGSNFSVTLPTGSLTRVAMQEIPSEVEMSVDNIPQSVSATKQIDCRVLLAEDGPDNQRLISFMLKKAGAEVTMAENGLIALELALEQREAGAPFDVILMDMQMPVLDGYAATGRLRAAGYNNPIIALTANAMSKDRDKCLNAGCDEYVTKPIDNRKLIETVANYANGVNSFEY